MKSQCTRKKCGEYNMLRCAMSEGHSGECLFVVDYENDYAHSKPRKSQIHRSACPPAQEVK